MGLFRRQVVYRVPPGCMVFWSNRLLHGHIKAPLDRPIEFGAYMGFGPAASQEERDLRRELYASGKAPALWPSGDKVQFYPLKYRNFPKIFKGQITDRMCKTRAQQLLFKRRCGNGQLVDDTRGWSCYSEKMPYVPYRFSKRGKRVMGLKRWEPRFL